MTTEHFAKLAARFAMDAVRRAPDEKGCQWMLQRAGKRRLVNCGQQRIWKWVEGGTMGQKGQHFL